MKNVKKLLEGKLPNEYNDQIFWYASKVLLDDDCVKVYVENENLVCFDDVDLDMKKISNFISITHVTQKEKYTKIQT